SSSPTPAPAPSTVACSDAPDGSVPPTSVGVGCGSATSSVGCGGKSSGAGDGTSPDGAGASAPSEAGDCSCAASPSGRDECGAWAVATLAGSTPYVTTASNGRHTTCGNVSPWCARQCSSRVAMCKVPPRAQPA